MTQLHDQSALQQSAAIKRGDFSCLELTQHYLARTERHGDRVGAFITVLAERALTQAAELDRRLSAESHPERLSPLFGTIAPVKDLDLVAGERCTFGSRVFQDFVPPQNAVFVDRMLAAGLVITGKTNTPEFGFPCYTENDLAPAARTPWDLTRSAAGSSGGAAAAVSSGLASVAQGSDGGGSIRSPASVTGLVGIKPSRGRITAAPLVDPVGELPVLGPLGRTVADAAALLDVLAGSATGDLFPAAPSPRSSFLDCATRDVGRLRIGRFSDPILAETTVDSEVLAAYEAASLLLSDIGLEVVDIQRPYGPEVVPSFEDVWSVGAASIPVPPDSESLLLPLTVYLRERGRSVTGVALAQAVSLMRSLSRQAVEATASFDVVLTPTLAQLPAAVGGLRNDSDPAADFEAQKAFTPFTAAFNVSGQPAMSLPFGMSVSGLPIGVQIVGRPNDEATLIALAGRTEAEIRWQDRKPPVWQE